MKCAEHEYRAGEYADGPRYTQALAESRRCWRCRLLAVLARLAQRIEGTKRAEP